MKYFIQGLMVSAIIALSGCASFHQEKIPLIETMPDTSQYQNLPSVYVDFDFYRGKPDENPQDVDQVEPELLPMVKKVVDESKLFSQVSYNEADQENMDYTIRLRAYNHGEVGLAAVGGFLTGFTLGIIPSAATDQFSVVMEVLDNSGSSLHSNDNHDEITTWLGIWFIPVMGNTIPEAVEASLSNQIKHALKAAFESGAMQYSYLMYPLRNA